MARDNSSDERGAVVIGLGRFGSHLASTLVKLGHDVLAVDTNPVVVQRWSEQLTRVVQADSTDESTLRQLGVEDFPRVVVALGASVEASILTVLASKEIGAPEIWARATSNKHAKILASVGADHVIFPEQAMAERVAHLIISKMLDFIEFDDEFAIAKVRVPGSLIGRPLRDIALAQRYGVMVLGTKSPGERFQYAYEDMVFEPNSTVIVEGSIDQVQRFAEMT